MKNLLKTSLLAIMITVSVTACELPKPGTVNTPVDSTKTSMDTAVKQIDTAKKDEVKTPEGTLKKDTVKQ